MKFISTILGQTSDDNIIFWHVLAKPSNQMFDSSSEYKSRFIHNDSFRVQCSLSHSSTQNEYDEVKFIRFCNSLHWRKFNLILFASKSECIHTDHQYSRNEFDSNDFIFIQFEQALVSAGCGCGLPPPAPLPLPPPISPPCGCGGAVPPAPLPLPLPPSPWSRKYFI